jgi:hypothetical protein
MPILSTGVAVSALVFQTCVLYPWHEQLDEELKELRKEHKDTLKLYHESKLQRLDELERRITKQEQQDR